VVYVQSQADTELVAGVGYRHTVRQTVDTAVLYIVAEFLYFAFFQQFIYAIMKITFLRLC
jgi:type IV secretory pathway VirB3-like protein